LAIWQAGKLAMGGFSGGSLARVASAAGSLLASAAGGLLLAMASLVASAGERCWRSGGVSLLAPGGSGGSGWRALVAGQWLGWRLVAGSLSVARVASAANMLARCWPASRVARVAFRVQCRFAAF